MPLPAPLSLVIWRLSDGKPGHEKQTLGLCHALGRLAPAKTIDIRAHDGWRNTLYWAAVGRYPPGRDLPAPDLLVGAGHATHLPLLAARRAHGGRTVVLMKPSLPLALFDLCLIPEHDAPPPRPNVIPTLGALNDVAPGGEHDPPRGLILVGGPSPHFRWDSRAIARQIIELTRARPELDWRLTTSRRTPADFLDGLDAGGLELFPAEATPPGWLERQLAEAGEAWVTPDSVSMVYEALTSGCRVGLFDLPAVHGSRVAKGVMALEAQGRVATFPQHPPAKPLALAEAARCAGLILEKWFA